MRTGFVHKHQILTGQLSSLLVLSGASSFILFAGSHRLFFAGPPERRPGTTDASWANHDAVGSLEHLTMLFSRRIGICLQLGPQVGL
jgi:hypothetical protein